MSLVNCTPHPLAIHANGEVLRLESSGICPRLTPLRTALPATDGIPTRRTTMGAVVGLPEHVEGTYLIVSGLVLAARPDRTDLRSPGEAVRDADGKIIGCLGLCA
jgi:hypothetical protein